VVGFVWSNDPESYAGGSVATIRVFLTGDVEDDDPDQEGLVLLGGGWGVRLTTLTSLKICY